MLSHVNGSPVTNLKLCILRSVDEISNHAKAQTLLSTLTALADDEQSTAMEARFNEKDFEEFETLVLRSLDASIVTDLNSDDAGLWLVFVGLLKRYMTPGEPF